MESIVKLNKLPDSFRVLFKFKVKIPNLSSNGLCSFKNLLRNCSNYCFILVLEYLFDLSFERFHLEYNKTELDKLLTLLNSLFVSEVGI